MKMVSTNTNISSSVARMSTKPGQMLMPLRLRAWNMASARAAGDGLGQQPQLAAQLFDGPVAVQVEVAEQGGHGDVDVAEMTDQGLVLFPERGVLRAQAAQQRRQLGQQFLPALHLLGQR